MHKGQRSEYSKRKSNVIYLCNSNKSQSPLLLEVPVKQFCEMANIMERAPLQSTVHLYLCMYSRIPTYKAYIHTYIQQKNNPKTYKYTYVCVRARASSTPPHG